MSYYKEMKQEIQGLTEGNEATKQHIKQLESHLHVMAELERKAYEEQIEMALKAIVSNEKRIKYLSILIDNPESQNATDILLERLTNSSYRGTPRSILAH